MTSNKKKPYKKVPRSKLKHPTFHIKRAPRSRWEELEVDYLNQLSPSEKDFLNQFQEEFVCANFGKKDSKEDKEKLLDKTDKYRKEMYGKNNRRNRDILTRAKAYGLTTTIQSDAHLSHFIDNDHTNYNHTEDQVVDYLDEKKKQETEKS